MKPYDMPVEEGYSYYLKFQADDLSDAAISMLRSWLIDRLGSFFT